MEMSINRALSELKLLNKKITDKTDRLQVAGAVMAAQDDLVEIVYKLRQVLNVKG